MIEDRIAEVLRQRFNEEDLQSCFLVDVVASKSSKVSVFVDADEDLTIEKCRKISRFLEKQIEENNWLPEKYTLDVSSPGTDNPLKLNRQYVKNVGRKAKVVLLDGSSYEGKIEQVSDDELVLELEKNEVMTISFENIKETKILVSFK